jgi:outer membrane protein OmpA-like peptidoglycan-associated protein
MILTASPLYLQDIESQREKKVEQPTWWFKVLFLCGLCLFFISCASTPEKKISYDPTAIGADEIKKLQTEMTQAEGGQIEVLSPKNFARANQSLEKAKDLQDKGASNDKILNELGNARGFFEQARGVAMVTQAEFPDVIEARENALIAGAALHRRKDLQEADKKLIDLTEEFEKKNPPKVSLKEKADLQSQYLDLELNSIKATRLGDIQSTIENARKMGAEKYAPRSLSMAQTKLKRAEMDINTDRHNDALITSSANDAMKEAQKLVKVTDISRKTGKTGNEGLAVAIVERDEKIHALNEQRAAEETQLRDQQARLQQEQQLRQQDQTRLQQEQRQIQSQADQKAASAQRALEARRRIDSAYAQAQNVFSPQEAEVYRQGDNLIFRMKAVQFPSGSSDLPSSSFRALNKVRDIVQNMNAQQVIVEGHTDSTGDPDVNQDISQERAEAVAEYLRESVDRRTGGSSPINIEAEGYGDEHPISTNKTKQGRALNRRVDIIVSPNFATLNSEEWTPTPAPGTL